MTTLDEMCGCGKPLHYSSPIIEQAMRAQVERLGRTIVVSVAGYGAYDVPRHYIALHGIRGEHVPKLAEKYGWSRTR